MENLNNLPPFYVGQKLVYIGHYHSLKNTIHIVEACYKKDCGCYVVQSKTLGKNESNLYNCITCNSVFMDYGTYTANAISFRQLQESPFPLLTYSKVVEKESELISLN